jgi:nucleobase transporter 1/2
MADEEYGSFKQRVVPWPIDSAPPWGFSILAGLQHIFTLFGATTLVPILFGNAMGMTDEQKGLFIATVYMVMGLATLLHVDKRIGSGLPIVQGSSFSFIPPLMAVFASVKKQGGGVPQMMQAMGGALFYGGIVELVVGYSGLIGLLKRVLTPVAIGPTIMLIGFGLAGVAVSNASTNWWLSLLVVALIFTFSLIAKNKKLNAFSVLLSVVIVYLIALFGTLVGWFPAGNPAHVNIGAVGQARWIVWPTLYRYGLKETMKFNVFAFTGILAAYTASMIESVGDYYSVCYASGAPEPSEHVINWGIGSEGLGCIISGMMGGVGSTSYTENIGVIALTGIASNRVIRTGAVILIIIGFFWKFGTLVATIPTPVIGGAYIALFGIIGGLGIQTLSRADLSSMRNIMIIAFAFLMGLGLPGYMQAHPIVMSGGWAWLGDILNGILETGMAVGGLSAAFLDNIIPGTDAERGLNVRAVNSPR